MAPNAYSQSRQPDESRRGVGLYDRPTGRRVRRWGMSQLYFTCGRSAEEWMLVNESDIMAQSLRDEPAPLKP